MIISFARQLTGKRGGYVRLFQKKLPTLVREWVTSVYFLVSRIISCNNCSDALMTCTMKVAQSRRGSLPLCFLTDFGTLPLFPRLLIEGLIWKSLTYPSPSRQLPDTPPTSSDALLTFPDAFRRHSKLYHMST